jgi:SAM-dependent methyltransferase
MDPEYGRAYRHLFERHWWWRAREEVIVDTLERYRPPGGWRDILDVGCGDGLFFDTLARFGESVEGVEPAEELVNGEGDGARRIHITPFDDTFQPGKRYSLILMLDVLEHIPDATQALRRVRDLLEPGGLFVVTVPAFPVLWTHHDDVNHHLVRYTKKSLSRALTNAGLAAAHCEYFFHWTFPAKLVVRAMERVLPRGNGVESVPAKPINSLFLGLSRLERRIVRGALPFGSSLIAVCRPLASHTLTAAGTP